MQRGQSSASQARRVLTVLALVFLVPATFLRADDWKTIDGKVYQDVKVVKVETDAVTILDRFGGALIPLDLLPALLQKQFNYDPVAAKAAADARMQMEIENARALREEMIQILRQRAALVAAEANEGASSPLNVTAESEQGQTSFTHYGRNNLVDPTVRLMDDHPDALHYSMSSLDHRLADVPYDSTHHGMSELFSGGL